MLGEVDTTEKIQTIRFNGKAIEIDLDEMLQDSVKLILARILNLAESTFNGIRIPKRTPTEYDNEPWVNIQIEEYVIGLMQKRISDK